MLIILWISTNSQLIVHFFTYLWICYLLCHSLYCIVFSQCCNISTRSACTCIFLSMCHCTGNNLMKLDCKNTVGIPEVYNNFYNFFFNLRNRNTTTTIVLTFIEPSYMHNCGIDFNLITKCTKYMIHASTINYCHNIVASSKT